jgi:8-oxo-dGTP diphosphatase
MAYCYEHPHPAVSVDVAVFTFDGGGLRVLLVRRGEAPFAGRWALPGGFVDIDESLKRAAWRELREETGVQAGYLEQLGAFGHPDRDPRERVITVVYFALVSVDRIVIAAGSDAREARLFALQDLPELAFDHERIMRRLRERLRDRASSLTFALRLMPAVFTLSELQAAQEQLTGQRLDKRNFRKFVLGEALIEPTGAMQRGAAHRPAQLFRRRTGAGQASPMRESA